MPQTYANLIAGLVDRIEERLDDPPPLDELSSWAGLSKFHLHRLFHLVTGHPPGEYIQRRRLAESLGPLCDTNRPVIAIALDYGFDYEQSYIRAFRRHFGTSPGRYRTGRDPLPILPRFNPSSLTPIGEDTIALAPRMVQKPSTTIVGLRRRIDLQENTVLDLVRETALDFYDQVRPCLGDLVQDKRYLGVVIYSGDPEWNWYLAGAELRPRREAPAALGLETLPLPTCRMARFDCISRKPARELTWKEVSPIYSYIFQVWLPAHPPRDTFGWHLEYADLARPRKEWSEFAILMPLSRVSPETTLQAKLP